MTTATKTFRRRVFALWLGLVSGTTTAVGVAHADATRLKPFVLASNRPGDFQQAVQKVQQALEAVSKGVEWLGST